MAKNETEKLKRFAREIIKDYCWGLQIDGPDSRSIQDLAKKHGLLAPHIATEEDVGPEWDDCEVGDTIFKFTDILKDEDNEKV